MKELNKKLAEWAGFKWEFAYHDFYKLVAPDGGQLDLTAFRVGSYATCPNSTESLDACFKWLVPNIKGEWSISVGKHTDRPTYYGRIQGFYFDSPQYRGDSNESPALALCLAIEKLIDGGG